MYDVASTGATPPVELEPGEYTATVELLDVTPAPDPGGLGYEVLGTVDTFTWTFDLAARESCGRWPRWAVSVVKERRRFRRAAAVSL